MIELLGVIIGLIGVLITILIYYRQKTSKKQKVQKELVDLMVLKIQTKEQITAQYIGAEISSVCRRNGMKNIEILDVINDLISEYSRIKTQEAIQIVNKLIKLRLVIAKEYLANNEKEDLVKFVMLEYSGNEGYRKDQAEYIKDVESINKSTFEKIK